MIGDLPRELRVLEGVVDDLRCPGLGDPTLGHKLLVKVVALLPALGMARLACLAGNNLASSVSSIARIAAGHLVRRPLASSAPATSSATPSATSTSLVVGLRGRRLGVVLLLLTSGLPYGQGSSLGRKVVEGNLRVIESEIVAEMMGKVEEVKGIILNLLFKVLTGMTAVIRRQLANSLEEISSP